MSEKTEQPTPKKLRDARKDGQVAHSKEVVSAVLMIVIFVFLWVFSDFYMEQFEVLILLPTRFYDVPFGQALALITDSVIDIMVAILLPFIAMVIFTAIIANVGQVGLLFSFKSITPDIKKINPAEGAKKIFAKKNLFEVLKSIVKILFLGTLIYLIIEGNINDFGKIPGCGIDCLTPFVGGLFFDLMVYSGVAFFIVAAIDYFFQKSQHIKQLMMSKDEVQREYKEMEGDPQIKGKRKQLHKELLNSDIKPRVKASSAIVVNPTHVAVGIYYEKGKVDLPLITIMGTDDTAQYIKKIARENDIPIMENIPLARGLLAAAEVDEYIPSEFIQPVAEVLKWLRSLEREQ